MFKRILIPIDGSDTANQAIEKAVALAIAFKAQVQVVCVVDVYPFTGIGTDLAYGQAQYLSMATAEAHEATAKAIAVFNASGIDATSSVVEGQAIYRAILDAAAASGADLIVMGSHGRKGLQKLVLGSVASQILSNTHLPVLIVRE